jgi:hypothetical protein
MVAINLPGEGWARLVSIRTNGDDGFYRPREELLQVLGAVV